MLLYTHHPTDFDIVNTSVKRELSPYVRDEIFEFRKYYEWLFNFLGIDTEEVIWCRDDKNCFCWNHGVETVLWTLDIPEEVTLYKINMNVWDTIIMGCHYIPDNKFEGVEDNEESSYDKIIIECENKYLMEETWKRYLLDIKSNDLVEYIVPQPIKEEWVVEKQWFSGYDPELIDQGQYFCSFYEDKTKEKVIDAIRSLTKSFRSHPYYNEQIDDNVCFTWPTSEDL